MQKKRMVGVTLAQRVTAPKAATKRSPPFRAQYITGGRWWKEILRAAALSFARGLEVGRAAKDEDEKKPA